MKNINEMNVRQLRQAARELKVRGYSDMKKDQLIDAITKMLELIYNVKVEEETKENLVEELHEEVKAQTVEEVKETRKKRAIRVQREFVAVGEERKEVYGYISIRVLYANDANEASAFVDAICAMMGKLDDEYEVKYAALKCPDIEEDAYTDMIAFNKVKGSVADQRKYVGKLMTKAMLELKKVKEVF